MTVKEKYQPVLTLGEKLGVENGYWKEENGVIKMGGTTRTSHEKDLLWNKIKEIGGASPSDIEADITYKETDFYAVHEVTKGDTLWGISEHYYGKGKGPEYKKIHAFNPDVVAESPNTIHIGWVLKIPFLDKE